MSLYQVRNPATDEVVEEFETSTDAAVQDAIARSHAAYDDWRATPYTRRAQVLNAVADAFEERRGELADIITTEMGKRTVEAHGEVKLVVSIFRYYAENGERLLADDRLDPAMGGEAAVRKLPIGPLLGIMPWNFPYYQVARFAAPNLMAGNTILLKHAPQCPSSARVIAEIFRDAGLPEGCYENLYATNEQAADIIEDARVRGVSVTGSERAGASVAETAGRNLKKVVLELGGSDPFVVLDVEDLGAAVTAAVIGRMGNAGQACNGTKRVIVLDELYDDFLAAFGSAIGGLRTGDPTSDDTDYGPLSSTSARDTLMQQIQDALDQGATLVAGGEPVPGAGAFMQATVLADVTPDMRAYHEELFGPCAVVYRAADVEDAVRIANDSTFGLGGTVWSADPERAQQVADRLDTGMVWINSSQGSAADLPFGGTKRSGVGRELGSYGIEEFLNKKLVFAPHAG